MGFEVQLPGRFSRWHYRQIVEWLGPLVMTVMGGWHVSGTQHVPAEGPALICPNHVSYLDPPVIGMAAYRRCCFMAKQSLFEIPLLGPFIANSHAYPVDRDEGGRQAIRIATTLLLAGEAVVMFPEGRRSPNGELIAGQAGAAYVASRANAPIIPAAVWGTDVVLPLHARRLYRCPVYVRFGPALHVPAHVAGERLPRQALQAATDELMARIAGLQQEIQAEVPARWLKRAADLKSHWQAARAAHSTSQESPHAE